MVKVLNLDTDQVVEMSPEDAIGLIAHAPSETGSCAAAATGSSCFLLMQGIRNNTCLAERLMDVVKVRNPLLLPGAGSTEGYRILPQSSATNAAFAERAYVGLVGAAQFMLQLFYESGGDCGSSTSISGAALVKAYYDAEEALNAAVEYTLAVADGQLGSTTSLSQAKARGYSGALLSRAAAAHLLVGGIPGIQGNTSDGLCTSNRLSAPAKAALEVLREAGVSPADIQSTAEFGSSTMISLDVLLNGAQSGSVKSRLTSLWGAEFPANQSVQDVFGLTDDDFLHARSYLGQEIRAFARSHTKLVNVAGASTAKFAATANLPRALDRSYYSALMDSEFDPSSRVGEQEGGARYYFDLATDGAPPLVALHDWDPGAGRMYDYVSFVDYTHSWVRFLLGSSSIQTLPEPRREELVGALSLLASSDPREARIVDNVKARYLERRVSVCSDRYDEEYGLILVRGEEGLQCATQGHVESAPCDLGTYVMSSLNQLLVTNLEGFYGPGQGFERCVAGYYDAVGESEPNERLYVVVPRREGDLSLKSGTYRALGGFLPYAEYQTPLIARSVPVVPWVQDKVADLLAPSPDWCTAAQVDCALDGSVGRFDERLPLEDELSSDGDDVESSWKHYLGLARQAAAESDLLANEYIQASLQADAQEDVVRDKASWALEELQEICGTAVDIAPLLSMLGNQHGETFDLDTIDMGPCSSTLPPGTQCINGRAIKSWFLQLANGGEQSASLVSCIAGFSATAPLIQLGDEDVCLWSSTENAREVLCRGGAQARCPYVRAPGKDCEAPSSGPVKQTIRLPAKDGLGLIDTKGLMPPDPDPNLCDYIRQMRVQPASKGKSDERIQKLIESNMFHKKLGLDKIRTRLGNEMAYGGYVSILVDGKPRWSTGTPTSGISHEWPCSENGAPDCTDQTGLFCSGDQGCSPENIGRTNERLIEAVLAVDYMTRHSGAPKFGPTRLPAILSIPTPRNSYTQLVHSVVTRYGVESWSGGVPVKSAGGMFWFDSANSASDLFRYGATVGGSDWVMSEVSSSSGGELEVLSFTDAMYQGTLPGNFSDLFFGGLSLENIYDGYLFRLLTVGRANLPISPPEGVYYPFFWDRSDARRNYTVDPRERLLRPEVLLDGLELMCAVNVGVGASGASCGAPPVFNSLNDLGHFGDYVACLGRDIQRTGAVAVFEGLPQSVIQELRGSSNAFQTEPGRLGAALSNLRQALMGTANTVAEVGRLTQRFGGVMRDLRDRMAIYELDEQMASVRFQAETMSRVTECLSSVASAAGLKTVTSGAGAAAASVCLNAIAQIGFAAKLRDLGDEKTQVERDMAIGEFEDRFNLALDELAGKNEALSSHLEGIRNSLGVIETLKLQARRSVERALWYMTGQAASAGYKGSKVLSEERYRRAHKQAQRMAFLAKRAVEQRLGLHLSDIREDLPLVESPQAWESSVCRTEPIDYGALKSGDGVNAGRFADAFIGAYVKRLEAVVESYRQKYNFHEGGDVVVASLRDDVQNVRAECQVLSRNLLWNSNWLSRLVLEGDDSGEGESGAESEEQAPGWSMRGCVEAESVVDCIGISRATRYLAAAEIEVEDNPLVGIGSEERAAPAFELLSGDGNGCVEPESCSWQQGAFLGQDVELTPGVYRFSWYEKTGSTGTQSSGVVLVEGDEPIPLEAVIPANGGWARGMIAFEVDKAVVATVGFRTKDGADGRVKVAAPMLERVDISVPLEGTVVGAYEGTGETRYVNKRICEDSQGVAFRAGWERKCETLCADGFKKSCSESSRKHCYWETTFHLSQRQLEAGRMFVQSGFARGNFNYRIGSLALNFVGTGIRACEENPLPSACYGGGFVPYTLVHEGPYYVRNHFGADFSAKLFAGRIEHARGLGNERYLSNPLGSSDESLLAPYLRTEFRGRPLDGNFVLRVWDEPGLNFDRIEDVQLVLNYQYWTRFN